VENFDKSNIQFFQCELYFNEEKGRGTIVGLKSKGGVPNPFSFIRQNKMLIFEGDGKVVGNHSHPEGEFLCVYPVDGSQPTDPVVEMRYLTHEGDLMIKELTLGACVFVPGGCVHGFKALRSNSFCLHIISDQDLSTDDTVYQHDLFSS
jgi:dTDP-4-dehydrorhamnose 3,5-epimerase-like enzyme